MATNAFEAIRKAYPDSVKYETNYNRLQKELQALEITPFILARQKALIYSALL